MKYLRLNFCLFLTGILLLGGILCPLTAPVYAAEAEAAADTVTAAETEAGADTEAAAETEKAADTEKAAETEPASETTSEAAVDTVAAPTGEEPAAGQAGTDAGAQTDPAAALPVMDSNSSPVWPQGPQIHSASAVLMEAETGTILYGKDIHARRYPASITKLMTALLTFEYLKMDEMVSFSNEAVFGIDRDSSNIGIDVGEEMTVEECLYGLLVASANEVAVALSEKVAGSQDNFARMMNARARELGCVDTHFASASGLHDPEHYTSAYDMALIGREFFRHEELAAISNTPSYHFKRSAGQPDDFWVHTLNELTRGLYEYNGSTLVGSKTGFTDEARQTLVTCAEKDGMRLICVVMQSEKPQQYEDTCKLLDFGFENFTTISLSENEHRFTLAPQGFFRNGNDVFGVGVDPFTVAGGGLAAVPKGVTFEDLSSTLVKRSADEESAQAEAQESADEAADAAARPVMGGTEADDGAGTAGTETGTTSDAQNTTTQDTAAQDAGAQETASEEAAYEPLLDKDGNIIMGTLVYTYQGVQVGTTDVLFLKSAFVGTQNADPAEQAADEDTNAAPVYGSRRDGIAGMFIDYFTGLLHRGTNGTLYVDVPSALFMVVLLSMILIGLITGLRYLLYMATEGRTSRRRRSRRTAARRTSRTRTLSGSPSARRTSRTLSGSPSARRTSRSRSASTQKAGTRQRTRAADTRRETSSYRRGTAPRIQDTTDQEEELW